MAQISYHHDIAHDFFVFDVSYASFLAVLKMLILNVLFFKFTIMPNLPKFHFSPNYAFFIASNLTTTNAQIFLLKTLCQSVLSSMFYHRISFYGLGSAQQLFAIGSVSRVKW